MSYDSAVLKYIVPQKILIEMWDAVSQEEIEALQRQTDGSADPAGGNKR